MLAACAAEQQAAEEVEKTSSHARGIMLSAKEKNLIQLADASRRSENIKEAARLYRQAIDMSQGAVDAHLSLASLLVEREKNIPAALEVLERARTLQPGNPEVLRRLGNGLVDLGRLSEALEVYGDWATRIPTDPRAHNAKGVALDMLDRHVEAQEAYRKGLSHVKDDAGYIENNLALSLLSMGQYDEAIPMLEKIYAKAESNETVRQNLALAYGLAGKPEKAAGLLKGMSPQQIEENQKFYRYIRDQQQKTPEPPKAVTEDIPAKEPEAKKRELAPPAKKEPEKKPEPVAPRKEPLLTPEPLPEEKPEAKPEPEAPAEPVKELLPVDKVPEPLPEPAKSINTLPTKRSLEKQEAPQPEPKEEPAPEEPSPDDIVMDGDEEEDGEGDVDDENTPPLPASLDAI